MVKYIRRQFLRNAAWASAAPALAMLESRKAVGAGTPTENRLEGCLQRHGTIASLLAIENPASILGVVLVDGYHVPGDGGGGIFVWDATSTERADEGLIFTPSVGGMGRWRRDVDPTSRARVNVRWFGAQGDGTHDDTGAIQAACAFAARLRGTAFLPNGQYKTTSTLYTYDKSASPGTTACALAGEGMFSARIKPEGDFTALVLTSSYADQGGFSIEWPATPRADISPARIGFEVADPDHMVSQCRIHDILVMYAYQSVRHQDWTAAATRRGTAYVVDYERIISFRAADWGFYIRPAKGSASTHRFSTCWANCSDSENEAGGQGFWLSGVNDIVMINCAVDRCRDQAIRVGDGTAGPGGLSGYQFTAIGTALESCLVSTQSVALINLDGPLVANLVGLKEIATTVRMPRSSDSTAAVFSNQPCVINLQGYCRSGLRLVSGTLYKVGLNNPSARVDCDRSIQFDETLDNGWYTQISWGGMRYSSSGKAPTQGTNQRGEYVCNMQASAGSPLGWYCMIGGSPGSWVPTGQVGASDIAATPSFIGQVAVSDSVGYIAIGTSSPLDWKRATAQ